MFQYESISVIDCHRPLTLFFVLAFTYGYRNDSHVSHFLAVRM